MIARREKLDYNSYGVLSIHNGRRFTFRQRKL